MPVTDSAPVNSRTGKKGRYSVHLLSDILQVIGVYDIFTWMDSITGLKSSPRTGFYVTAIIYCNTSFLCDILRQIWNWHSIWSSPTSCVWFPMSYRAEYRFQSALNSHLTWVRIMESSLQTGFMAHALNLKSVKSKIWNGNRKRNLTVCRSWCRQAVMHWNFY